MPRLSLSSVAGALLPPIILVTVSLVIVATPGHAQTLAQRNISVAQAMAVVDAVIESCGRDDDLVTVSVAVVDRAGQPRVMVWPGARPIPRSRSGARRWTGWHGQPTGLLEPASARWWT